MARTLIFFIYTFCLYILQFSQRIHKMEEDGRMMTTTSSMEIQPDDLLLMVMNPDDLRDLWKTSITLWSEADKKIRGVDITFNELAGVMAMSRCVAQSNGVVRRFYQDRHKKKRKPLLVFLSGTNGFIIFTNLETHGMCFLPS